MTLTARGPIPIIDADSHITEPADVWTSRVQKRFLEYAPRVELNPATRPQPLANRGEWFWPCVGSCPHSSRLARVLAVFTVGVRGHGPRIV